MTPADLEAVVARTGHSRFRWLTSDANPDAASREAYRRAVARLAAGAPPAPPPEPVPPVPGVAGDLADLARIHACPHFSRPEGCGCEFGRCGLTGRPTSFPACRTCLAAAEPPPL